MAVFVKYEFWYHHYNELYNRNIPILVISSIFRSNQVFFKNYGALHRRMLEMTSTIFTQDNNSIDLLETIQIQNGKRAGDTRFDRVWEIRNSAEEIDFLPSFKSDQKILVIGSCWKEDLDVLIPYINNGPAELKYIIAPHEITSKNIQILEKQIQLPSIKYSDISEDIGDETRVLIIDSIGLLSRLYKYGEYAFVGGAFGDGLHNILEPAAFGLPVFFGNKNYQKFKEAVQLIEMGGAFSIKDYFEFEQKFNPLLDDSQRELCSEIVSGYVKSNTGATNMILKNLNQLLNEGNSN